MDPEAIEYFYQHIAPYGAGFAFFLLSVYLYLRFKDHITERGFPGPLSTVLSLPGRLLAKISSAYGALIDALYPKVAKHSPALGDFLKNNMALAGHLTSAAALALYMLLPLEAQHSGAPLALFALFAYTKVRTNYMLEDHERTNNRLSAKSHSAQEFNSKTLTDPFKFALMIVFGLFGYRATYAVAFSMLVEHLLARYKGLRWPIRIFAMALIIVAAIKDYKSGPFMPPPVHGPMAIKVMAIAIALSALYSFLKYYYITRHTEPVFIVCPRCGCWHPTIVAQCTNCGAKGEAELIAPSHAPMPACPDFPKALGLNWPEGLRAAPSARAAQYIAPLEAECVALSYRRFIGTIIINDMPGRCKEIILTNQRLLLLDYPLLHRGWRSLREIRLADMERILLLREAGAFLEQTILKFESRGETYALPPKPTESPLEFIHASIHHFKRRMEDQR